MIKAITIAKVHGTSHDGLSQSVTVVMPAGYEKSAMLWTKHLCTDCGQARLTWFEPWHDVAGCLGCGETARFYIGE